MATRPREPGVRTLANVKEEQQSDDSIYEPVVLKPCEQPMLPEQDMSQPALLLLKGKNAEKEDLRARTIMAASTNTLGGRLAMESSQRKSAHTPPTWELGELGRCTAVHGTSGL